MTEPPIPDQEMVEGQPTDPNGREPVQAQAEIAASPLIEVQPAVALEASEAEAAEERRIAIARNDQEVERELRGR